MDKARGATIYGEVLGHGSSVAVDQRCRANAAVALENALRATLRSAGCDAREVGHVHAHGLSAVQSDIDESRALNAVFRGESAIPVVAAKSHFGNLGAASGVVELIGSLQALRHGNLFPVLNYEHPDPACPVAVVRDSTTPAGSTFVNLNITPQGQASAVLIGLA